MVTDLMVAASIANRKEKKNASSKKIRNTEEAIGKGTVRFEGQQ